MVRINTETWSSKEYLPMGILENTEKLKKNPTQIKITGEGGNSYSKTDDDATFIFMRMKKDYMGNNRLLLGYNMFSAANGKI